MTCVPCRLAGDGDVTTDGDPVSAGRHGAVPGRRAAPDGRLHRHPHARPALRYVVLYTCVLGYVVLFLCSH